jgi:hypothetical protein
MAKKLIIIFGWIFIVLGVLGFIPNPIVGSAPGALFAADTAHDIVRLLFGIIFIWIGYGSPEKSAGTLKIFGIIYLIIAILGFFSSSGTVLGLITTNTLDNWLALIFGLIFLWGGMSGKPTAVPGM